jgi:hypothetical protein
VSAGAGGGMRMELSADDGYLQLLEQISDTYTRGRVRAVQAVNTQLIDTYWQLGRHIVEFEQAGHVRAEYGAALIRNLAADLNLRHGKGFSRSNLVYIRLLYLRYPGGAPISQKASHQLSWSHYVELLKMDDALERGFYEQQALAERWSVPVPRDDQRRASPGRPGLLTPHPALLRAHRPQAGRGAAP